MKFTSGSCMVCAVLACSTPESSYVFSSTATTSTRVVASAVADSAEVWFSCFCVSATAWPVFLISSPKASPAAFPSSLTSLVPVASAVPNSPAGRMMSAIVLCLASAFKCREVGSEDDLEGAHDGDQPHGQRALLRRREALVGDHAGDQHLHLPVGVGLAPLEGGVGHERVAELVARHREQRPRVPGAVGLQHGQRHGHGAPRL